jgi:quercetin dioxygenase-like cupin family protein
MNGKTLSLLTAASLALTTAPSLFAQDPAAVAPGNYDCTFENQHTRVCEVTIAPGAKIPKHSHPQHLIHVISPGKLRITDVKTGKAEEAEFTAGQSVWIPAVTHHAENIGDTQIKALLIEFRDLKR